MTDLALIRWIRELNENGAVALARSVIMAEAGRLGLPLNGFSMSGRVKASDGGIDGRTQFPEGEGTLLPTGMCVWQVKSGATAPSADAEFDENRHRPLLEAIRAGADYVLFWTNDPVDPQRSGVTQRFTTAVQSVRSDATVTFIFAEQVERLCMAHVGVLAQQAQIPLSGVVSLEVWAPDEFRLVTYQADNDRVRFIEAIRSHVTNSSASPSEIHVYGDTGVGKSRLVYEALVGDGLRQRVLVVPDASSWEQSLLTLVAQSPERTLILVVDDCEADDRRSLGQYAGMAGGRVRLVTIGSRSTRERPVIDSRYLELLPLQAEASKEIALSVGLDESAANVVAGYTEGYPGLALTLAKAIRFGTPDGSLIERVRGHEEIGPVLSSLLPGEDVKSLGMLALFERLGFEGDFAQELTIACQVLDVDEAELRQTSERELQRFVSTAGRFRRVTPRLFAIWLASEFISQRRNSLSDALTRLPASLRERIINQMREFAGDAVVAETLGQLLDEHPFTSGAIADVDEGAARLLHVAAIVAPSAAIVAIERVLESVGTEQLSSYGPGRRETIWALQVLLWFEEFFERAANILLRFAIAENETWADNATGVLEGLFGVYLGGTGAPYHRRISWAGQALARQGEPALSIIIKGLGHALEAHESRVATDFGGRSAPEEWRPRLLSEEIEARSAAWDLLLELAVEIPSVSDQIAEVLAGGIRSVLQRGLADRVLADLRRVPWSPRGRGALGEAIVHAIHYDSPSPDLEADLRALEQHLQGQTPVERVQYVLSLSPWQLTDETDELLSGRPQLLVEVARELAAMDRSVIADAARRSVTGDQQTARLLFEEVAGQTADSELLQLVTDLRPLPEEALVGVLRGLARNHDDQWIDGALEQLLHSEHAHVLASAIHALPPTDHRANLALIAVDSGIVRPPELGRFLYGAWASSLGAEALVAVLRRLRDDASPYSVEHALGIFDQWLERQEGRAITPETRAVALDLIHAADRSPEGSSSMLGFYRSRVLKAMDFPFDERLQLFIQRLQVVDSPHDDNNLELLEPLARSDSVRTIDAILKLLLGDSDSDSFRPNIMWLENTKILTRLESLVGTDVIVERITLNVNQESWPELIAHMDLSMAEPNGTLRALVELSRNEQLWHQAAFRFTYPQSSWWGPESAYLRTRRQVAENWKRSAQEGSGFQAWLMEVTSTLDLYIREAERREAEGD
jgi:hypothetical protein